MQNVKYFSNSVFNGCPRFFGGKRKIANFILGKSTGDIFIDAFMGAGSISVFAKAQNKTVLANDYSVYANFIGRGIIENSCSKIDKYDLMKLFVECPDNQMYCEKHYKGDLFTTRHARFIDNAASMLNLTKKIRDPVKNAALNCMLMKFIFALRPYGNFNTSHMVDFLEQPFDSNKIKLGSMAWIKSALIPVWDLAFRSMENVNDSIFFNGKVNKFYNKDVFDFMQEVDGDTVYFDPPYYGAEPYEYYYDRLNSILLQEDLIAEKSNFNKDDWKTHFDQLLDLSQKIPRWIISFGCEQVTPAMFLEIVQKHRPGAELFEIPYIYSVGNAKKDESGKKKAVIEILMTADK